MHEKPDAKDLYGNFKCQFTVSIEVIVQGIPLLVKLISVWELYYTVHVLE